MDGSQSASLMTAPVHSRILSSASQQPLRFCQGAIKSHHHSLDSNWVFFEAFDVDRLLRYHKVVTYPPQKNKNANWKKHLKQNKTKQKHVAPALARGAVSHAGEIEKWGRISGDCWSKSA